MPGITKYDVKLSFENGYLTSEAERISLFENYRCIQLFGNGDGYIYGKSPDDKIRFQSCYLNQNELSQIIEIINNFYKK